MERSLSQLEEKLGLKFHNSELLKRALIHRSYLSENPKAGLQSNERLEFLGDAVLELVVSEFLFGRLPDKPEGELTKWRSILVNTKMLSKVARELGVNKFLFLSKGEILSNGSGKASILANCMEALIGAIYIDQGLDAARKFIEENITSHFEDFAGNNYIFNPKGRFQEEAQKRGRGTPTYEILDERGPDHAKNFKVGVFLAGRIVAEGEGHSKQEAEENAARKALDITRWDQEEN